MDEGFLTWMINVRKLSYSDAQAMYSHVRRLVAYNVALDEDVVRTVLWRESKYMRRNYMRAVRLYNEYLEWVKKNDYR